MKLFRRKKKDKKSIDEILSEVTEELLPEDLEDEHKVHHYLLDHCEQVIDSVKELEEQKNEYRILTSYLKDIQIIEDMPQKEHNILCDTAASIITLNKSRDDFLKTTKKITDSQFAQMQRDEEQITTAIRTLQSNEMYQSAVKRDMQYLEGEKSEWMYYRQELMNEQKILRRLAYGLFSVLIMLMTVIFVLQTGFQVDTKLMFTLLIASGAIGGMAIYLRMQNNKKEIKKSEVNMNHAIGLMNKTKVKYVHSTNAVDYACEKYHVHNSYELNYIWEQYQEAVREREKFERNSDDLDYFNGKLIRMLRQFNLYDPKVWSSQTHALLDKREMVEIKHNLIERRQKIRARIEYDMDVVMEQKEEIEGLMKKHELDMPEVREIIESVEKLAGM